MTHFVISHLKDFHFFNARQSFAIRFAASIKYSIILKTILFDCFKMMLYSLFIVQ